MRARLDTSKTLGRRALALVADALTLLFATAIIADLLAQASPRVPVGSLLLFSAVYIPFWFCYRVLAEAHLGCTPGKILFGLRVVDLASLKHPTVHQAVLRTLLRPVDGFPGFYLVGGFASFLHPEHARLGDRAAGTRVLRKDRLLSSAMDLGLMSPAAEEPSKKEADETSKDTPEGTAGVAGTTDARVGRERVARTLKTLSERGAYHVFDRKNLFLVVGPGGICIICPHHERGLLTVDEDEYRLLLDQRDAAVDPLERMRAALVEADRRLDVPLERGGGDSKSDSNIRAGTRAKARTLHDLLGSRGHDWLICYTHATLPDRLSSGVLKRHVVVLDDLVARITQSRPLFEDPRKVSLLAEKIGAAYEAKPYAAPGGSAGPANVPNENNGSPAAGKG